MIREYSSFITSYFIFHWLFGLIANIRAKKSVFFLIIVISVAAQGCGTIPERNALPQELSEQAQIPGIPDAKYWGDNLIIDEDWIAGTDAEIKERFSSTYGVEHTYLAISGGGSNGAFGAGLLVGWSASGTRPTFSMVTGISTGALIAPFAFLGPDYDAQLKEIYTTFSTDDLITKRRPLAGLTSDAMAGTTPLRAMIAKYIDKDIIQAIAAEYQKGRELNIGTTNLDAKRPVIWDIGHIASSGDPNAINLIHDILLASASIPVAFPPVMIEVEAGGKRYDEMHVDGGVSAQVFLYPVGIDWKRLGKILHVKGTPNVYMIRNAKLEPKWYSNERSTAPIAMSSITSLIRTQGIGDLFRIYLTTKRDGLNFHLAYIPDEFKDDPEELFDPVYMKKLFELGYNMAKEGYPWKTTPPGLVE